MRVIMWSHWHPNSNGTDYYAAVGHYSNLDEAHGDAREEALNRYEGEEDDEIEDEGPNIAIYDYDNDEGGPEWFDARREGGGSFEDDFARL